MNASFGRPKPIAAISATVWLKQWNKHTRLPQNAVINNYEIEIEAVKKRKGKRKRVKKTSIAEIIL